MREVFTQELSELSSSMKECSALCDKAITTAVKSFKDADVTLAHTLGQMLEDMDNKEHDIEDQCIKLFMRQQPVASDLRTVSSVMKVVTDMERIVCQSADMAEIVITARPQPTKEHMAIYENMAKTVKKMVRESVDAFISGDTEEARNVIKTDDLTDDYFNQIRQQLVREIQEKSTHAGYTIDLLMIAKYLERIGDHAVNISQWAIFSETGQLPKTHEDEEHFKG